MILKKTDMNIVIVGHVDHGKSTIIGRLLADTGSLPEGKLEAIRELCRRNSKPFEYAFLLDALKDERSQGITIDTARSFFATEKRRYIIIDAPGHIEFLKNMITGASRAEAALLVIDAHEGVRENSRRHGYMLSMLGIKQIAVVVNKMDLTEYSKKRYDDITAEYTAFLKQIGITPRCFIPVSAMQGDNIALRSANMPWYSGPTTLEMLDEFDSAGETQQLPFRLPVQDIYKFTREGDDRRIVAGNVETGSVKDGDRVIFYPSGKSSVVKSIEVFNAAPKTSVCAGESAGFTVTEQIYIKRGELACRADESAAKPHVGTRIKASIFWLGREPLVCDKMYFIKLASAKTNVVVEKILGVLNSSNLDRAEKAQVERYEVAECILRTEHPLAYDLASEMPTTGRFVLVDKSDYEISGGGIISEALPDKSEYARERVMTRNLKWEHGSIDANERAVRFAQKSTLVLITGDGELRKSAAKELENLLYRDGRLVYYMGFGSLLYGLDADIAENRAEYHDELIRRLGELANLLLDAGHILVVTARDISNADAAMLRDILPYPEMLFTVSVGGESLRSDLSVSEQDPCTAARLIKQRLCDLGVMFNAFDR